MKLQDVTEPKKEMPVQLDLYDFFIGETKGFDIFELRQVVKTHDGYGILRVRDGELFYGESRTIGEAVSYYHNIKKVELEEVHYKVVD